MKRIYIFICSLLLSGTMLLISKNIVSASEGTFELRSTNQNTYRCFAASLQMQNLMYQVTVSCREIVYPVDETIYSYILWANPVDGSKPVKLGPINLGKAEFSVKPPFDSLFITNEQNPGVKDPTGDVVMKGSIKPITFLEKPGTPAPTEQPGQKGTTSPQKSTTNTQSLRDKLLTGLKRAGLASALALVAILGLVFVLTRPRG